ncbi:hypothetical protein CR492_18345 [Methylocella silvestris]|uniref:Uncharacterized protein n=1 Tax=Methylocella silvestris TaxID=199596 RepID=A0A2J7TCN1_METSI|nr:hypothetical protein CR492_18345 [Methylocella silvestris]
MALLYTIAGSIPTACMRRRRTSLSSRRRFFIAGPNLFACVGPVPRRCSAGCAKAALTLG